MLLGIATAVLIIGFFLIGIVGIWAFIDVFLIGGWVEQANLALAKQFKPQSAQPEKPELITAEFATKQINDLTSMKEAGHISEDEFAQKKALIIARIG